MAKGRMGRWLAAAVLLPMMLAGWAAEPTAADKLVDAEAIATRLLDNMDAGDFAKASADFSPEMIAALGGDKLAAAQGQLESLGKAAPRPVPQVTTAQGMTVVIFRIVRGTTALDAVVAIDAAGKVAGLHFAPAKAAAPPAAAVPADARYREREVAVGSGATALPGTLAMPLDTIEAAVPGIVLVHGSGPQDRDESIGANHPFRDIARGLAQDGIATLRYDKRTRVRPQDFTGNYGVDAETTDDAVAAVDLLRTTPGVNPKRVYLLGHSQGGTLAGRIALHSGHVAGLVLLAAPARPILTLPSEQNRALVEKAGPVSAADEARLAALDAQIAAVRGTQPVADADAPMGVPAAYWRSIDVVDAIADAKAAKLPLLPLQGGRDMQVVDADWQLWKTALAGDASATLQFYPTLNHLGIAGSGAPSSQEYEVAGAVDARLIFDVARWVAAR